MCVLWSLFIVRARCSVEDTPCAIESHCSVFAQTSLMQYRYILKCTFMRVRSCIHTFTPHPRRQHRRKWSCSGAYTLSQRECRRFVARITPTPTKLPGAYEPDVVVVKSACVWLALIYSGVAMSCSRQWHAARRAHAWCQGNLTFVACPVASVPRMVCVCVYGC